MLVSVFWDFSSVYSVIQRLQVLVLNRSVQFSIKDSVYVVVNEFVLRRLRLYNPKIMKRMKGLKILLL